MFLKSLEIFGFKSFADRTRIEFPDGITALLGPNGCGKSNVVDAIKWVVGEQSAKSLRAENMEGIIFNGTETRKALSVAEVTVTISNEAGLLDLDLPEIAIKRRLYRSGEAEYFINGTQAKLKEIRELFWDTGIGKSAYSVMEQGKIDQILSSKPEERRYLFEEAAGITKHKVRSREAEQKLAHTEENVKQVQGILTEIKRSHDSLKVQSEKTLVYRGLRETIFEVELDLYLLRLRGFIQEKARRDQDIQKKTSERDALKIEIDALSLSLTKNLDTMNELEQKLADHQKTVYGLAVEKVGKEKERKLIFEKVSEARTKIDNARLREKTVSEKLEGLSEDEMEKEGELASLRMKLRDIQKNIDEFEVTIKNAELKIHSNEAQITRSEQNITQHEKERVIAHGELEAITTDIVKELDLRLKDIGYSSKERRLIEASIDSLASAISVKLTSKLELVKDILRLPGDSEQSAKLLQKMSVDLEETSKKMQELMRLYENYKKTTPSFLDDFLAPEGIITKKRTIDQQIAGIAHGVEQERANIVALRSENKELALKISEYRKTLEDLRGNRIRMETQTKASEDALAVLRREIAGQREVQRELHNEIASEEKRLADSNEQLSELDEELATIEQRGKQIQAEIAQLESEIQVRNSDLHSRQAEVKEKSERLNKLHIEVESLHLGRTQVETEIRNVKENFSEQYSRDLLEFETRMYEIQKAVSQLRDELSAAKQKLKELGQVNLMAPEEYLEVKERYDFLSNQLADLEKAKADLVRITTEIRNESAELFLATYNKIKKNFHNMFRRLFGGGRGEIRLADAEHILESGIDIYAQPPGKKLEVISLLSGGEKTLTAIALLFATYMVRPSPFCFLDEIDAALDEQNVIRFVNLLREFGRTSQFVVITHNKKTVIGASSLLGVTMEESGVTKVISTRLTNVDNAGLPEPEAMMDEDPMPEGDDTMSAGEDTVSADEETMSAEDDTMAAEDDTMAEVESTATDTAGEQV